jgi:hypothetical protein
MPLFLSVPPTLSMPYALRELLERGGHRASTHVPRSVGGDSVYSRDKLAGPPTSGNYAVLALIP